MRPSSCVGRSDPGSCTLAVRDYGTPEILGRPSESRYRPLLNGNSEWKLPLVARVFGGGRFSGKDSTLYGDGDNVHDFMHAKVTAADDHVFAGSYNLSHSGELNAENVLEFRDADLAGRLAGWVDEVAARYPPAPVPDLG